MTHRTKPSKGERSASGTRPRNAPESGGPAPLFGTLLRAALVPLLIVAAASVVGEWLDVGAVVGFWVLVAAVVAGAWVARRLFAGKQRRTDLAAVRRMGFRTMASYQAAARNRKRRLGGANYRRLVKLVNDANADTTGRQELADLQEFERAMLWAGTQHGVDARLF